MLQTLTFNHTERRNELTLAINLFDKYAYGSASFKTDAFEPSVAILVS
jgi:hypothetical protein